MAVTTVIDGLARTVLETALNGIWQSVLLIGIAWGLLRLFRGANAATRHLIWFATLTAILSLPLIAVIGRHSAPAYPVEAAPLAESSPLIAEAPANSYLEGQSRDEFQLIEEPGIKEKSDSPPTVEAPPIDEPETSPQPALTVPVVTLSPITLRLLFGAWLLISVFLIGRVISSYRYIKRVKQTCVPIESHCVAPLRKWAGVQADSRSARIALTSEIRMPMAIGLRAPLVALPEQLSSGLPEDELDQVILHELGHIQRWDDWANLIQKLIEALLFFNPAVLWLSRRLCLEREIACDDLVISRTGKARSYAFCLTRLASMTRSPIRPTVAPGALTGPKQLSRRIEMLLNKQRNVSLKISRPVLLVVMVILFAALLEFKKIGPVIALAQNQLTIEQSGGRLETAPADSPAVPTAPSASTTSAAQSSEAGRDVQQAEAERKLRESIEAAERELEKTIKEHIEPQQRELEKQLRESLSGPKQAEIEKLLLEAAEAHQKEIAKHIQEVVIPQEHQLEQLIRESVDPALIEIEKKIVELAQSQSNQSDQSTLDVEVQRQQRVELEKKLTELREAQRLKRAELDAKIRELVVPQRQELQRKMRELRETHRIENRKQLQQVLEKQRDMDRQIRQSLEPKRQEIERLTKALTDEKRKEIKQLSDQMMKLKAQDAVRARKEFTETRIKGEVLRKTLTDSRRKEIERVRKERIDSRIRVDALRRHRPGSSRIEIEAVRKELAERRRLEREKPTKDLEKRLKDLEKLEQKQLKEEKEKLEKELKKEKSEKPEKDKQKDKGTLV